MNNLRGDAGDNRGEDALVRHVDPWEIRGGDDDTLSCMGNGQVILHGHGDNPGGQDLEVLSAEGNDPGVSLNGGTKGALRRAGEEHDPGDDPPQVVLLAVDSGGEENRENRVDDHLGGGASKDAQEGALGKAGEAGEENDPGDDSPQVVLLAVIKILRSATI